MLAYWQSAKMSCLEKINGGLLHLLPDIAVQTFTLLPLLFLWRVLLTSGVDAGMSLPQMLSYTYVSALLSELLTVRTAATGWLSEGMLLRLYGRPLSVLGQLAAQTAGGWLPMLLFFSLPLTLLAPALGISLRPATPLFFPSLLLCVSLGFAMDFLFACLSIRLRGMQWLVDRIRMAVVALFSGAVIPLRLLPFGLGGLLRFQPFASLGGAPLSLLTGAAEPREVLGLQLLWNLLLWPLVLIVFKKSQERIVSYGG